MVDSLVDQEVIMDCETAKVVSSEDDLLVFKVEENSTLFCVLLRDAFFKVKADTYNSLLKECSEAIETNEKILAANKSQEEQIKTLSQTVSGLKCKLQEARNDASAACKINEELIKDRAILEEENKEIDRLLKEKISLRKDFQEYVSNVKTFRGRIEVPDGSVLLTKKTLLGRLFG